MLVVIVDDTPLNLTLMEKLVGRVGACHAMCFTDPVRHWIGARKMSRT